MCQMETREAPYSIWKRFLCLKIEEPSLTNYPSIY